MLDLYFCPESPPCRSVQMLAKALGIELNLKHLNLIGKEHLDPEFLKINPQHTVPTLVDGDFVLWESRAILAYLVEKYSENDSLYPRDPKKRALVNQRLYFDMGTLYQRLMEYFFPMMKGHPADPEKYKKVEEAVGFIDMFLESSNFAAGDEITIADYSLAASILGLHSMHFDFSRYSNVSRWQDLCKEKLMGQEFLVEAVEAMKKYSK